MKPHIIAIAILGFVINSVAQDFTGKAVYKTNRKTGFKIGGDSNMSEAQKQELEERFQKMNQKTFILEFDKTTSSYKEEEKLNAPNPQANLGGMQVISVFGGGGSGSLYFKNLKEKRFVSKTDIMGKTFLIKDSIPNYEWQLTSETKNIGNYTCYKATFTKEVENRMMTVENGETKQTKKTETIITTAWYTPQIPISNGPTFYHGLPGLILEINDGKTTIVCTEIVLNPSEKITISEPDKGKIVSQAEYDKIQDEKNKELMERFQSRDGKGIEIKIGG
ncbi:GLPGLI family protein [Polaribacter sp. BAL334]|uniref:GLPGLI family protein n=1 Tax=Polaribacter sp. BAL334 TaxID=1708178 RepID=UPI0018D25768|nr:GLPGLI family protein [Polaribacter sp. BAL334]MBG7612676.1 GLPGLI family protein [Polaribacter sp. BAL334]